MFRFSSRIQFSRNLSSPIALFLYLAKFLINFPISLGYHDDDVVNVTITTSRTNPILKQISDSFYPSLGLIQNSEINFETQKLFQTNSHCLISISTFVDINILQISQPIIIRKEILLLEQDKSMQHLAWALESCSLHFHSIKYYYFSSNSNSTNFCISFNFTSFFLHSKLWNCHLEIDLFPTQISNIINDLLVKSPEIETAISNWRVRLWNNKFWEYKTYSEYSESYGILPNTVPQTHLYLISETLNDTEFYTKESRKNFLISLILKSLHSVFKPLNHHFFLLELKQLANSKLVVVSKHKILFQNQELILLPIFAVKLQHLHQYQYKSLSSLQIDWAIDEYSEMSEYFSTCDNFKNLLFHKVDKNRKMDKLMGNVFAHLWTSVIKNYSIILDDFKQMFSYTILCVNGQSLNEVRKLGGRKLLHFQGLAPTISHHSRTVGVSLHRPLRISDPFSGFRFVSCGREQIEPLAFNQFLNVYDRMCWIFVLIAVISLVGIWKLISRSNNYNISSFSRSLSILKVLLEQGDPFPGSTFIGNDKNLLRIIFSTFLLMAIVLSNGYKNNNVYNMVLPRKPVIYERVEQLVNNSFQIYGFTGEIIILRDLEEFSSNNLSQVQFNNKYNDNDEITFAINEKVYTGSTELKILKQVSESFGLNYLTNKTIELNQFVYEHTKLYPIFSQLLNFEKFYSEINFNLLDRWEKRRLLNNEYHNLENKILFQLLQKCEKTAIVANSQMALNYSLMLVQNGANLGKEIYYQMEHYFPIIGLIPTEIYGRLANLKEFGIIERWMEILETISIINMTKIIGNNNDTLKVSKNSDSFNEPASATLKGNIVVIFSIILVGLSISFLVFIIEIISFKAKAVWDNRRQPLRIPKPYF